ncbi:hypothetical protein [Cribrihabitans neustonicus]|uniref:hypothetical protein n=1 Tax=Cribrihabitans neustonicus TaxID=1429085 RepID=UPI003B593CD9
MKQIVLPAVILAALAAPLSAQETGGAPDGGGNGSGLMQRGAEMFWEGLRKEMAPALEEFQGLMQEVGPTLGAFLSEMGPALAEIAREVEDWSVYELPEKLPNGDIIIRRKPDAPKPEAEPDTGPGAGPDGGVPLGPDSGIDI